MTYYVLERIYYDYDRFSEVEAVSTDKDRLKTKAKALIAEDVFESHRYRSIGNRVWEATDPEYPARDFWQREVPHYLITAFEED